MGQENKPPTVDSLDKRVGKLENEFQSAVRKEEITGIKAELLGLAAAAGALSSDFKIFKADWALFDATDFLRRFTLNQYFQNRRTEEGRMLLADRQIRRAREESEAARRSRARMAVSADPERWRYNAEAAEAAARKALDRARQHMDKARELKSAAEAAEITMDRLGSSIRSVEDSLSSLAS